jgi:hypothetical protein
VCAVDIGVEHDEEECRDYALGNLIIQWGTFAVPSEHSEDDAIEVNGDVSQAVETGSERNRMCWQSGFYMLKLLHLLALPRVEPKAMPTWFCEVVDVDVVVTFFATQS